jgi:hypothetical protein
MLFDQRRHAMESTVNRPAVDLDETPSRSVLAFVLALLSIPGTTVAWDLPAGGLWIGLPLAVGSIVLGVRSRRAASGSRAGLAIAAIVIGGLAILQMVVYTIASNV